MRFMTHTGFENVESTKGSYDLVTTGRGFCKIWAFAEGQSKLARVYE